MGKGPGDGVRGEPLFDHGVFVNVLVVIIIDKLAMCSLTKHGQDRQDQEEANRKREPRLWARCVRCWFFAGLFQGWLMNWTVGCWTGLDYLFSLASP
jgi:hypothetical protein